MGAGNKLDPTKFEVAIYTKPPSAPSEGYEKELNKRGVKNLKWFIQRSRP